MEITVKIETAFVYALAALVAALPVVFVVIRCAE